MMTSATQPGQGDSLEVVHDEGTDTLVVRVSVPVTPDTRLAVLALWSCWWSRWIGTLDCSFSRHQDQWIAEARLPAQARNLLSAVLQDVLSIKNAACIS